MFKTSSTHRSAASTCPVNISPNAHAMVMNTRSVYVLRFVPMLVSFSFILGSLGSASRSPAQTRGDACDSFAGPGCVGGDRGRCNHDLTRVLRDRRIREWRSEEAPRPPSYVRLWLLHSRPMECADCAIKLRKLTRRFMVLLWVKAKTALFRVVDIHPTPVCHECQGCPKPACIKNCCFNVKVKSIQISCINGS